MSAAIDLYALNTIVRHDENGRPHIGIMWVSDGMVFVADLGSLPHKAAAVSGKGSATALAYIMLGELMHPS